MQEPLVHVLIGPGSLGLGLLAPITNHCGFSIHLVGRPGGGGVPEFEYTLVRGDVVRSHRVKVEAFHCPPSAVVPYELRQALGAAKGVLITTTARSGIEERVQFVHALVDACAPDAEVMFAACENRLSAGHCALLEELPSRGVDCTAAMVDRVCREAEVFKPDQPRRVVGHEDGVWLLEKPNGAPRLTAALLKAPEVRFEVREQVIAELRRKLLLMNGTHFAIGLLAHANRQVSMVEAANDPAVLDVARELLDEFFALLDTEYEREETRQLGLRALRIICSFHDDVPRVMNSLKRGALPEFFEVFEERVAKPARLRATGAEAPEPFHRLARALVKILIAGDSYADARELARRTITLTEEGDQVAIRAFRGACTGWMSADWIDAQEHEVRRALRSQRARWA